MATVWLTPGIRTWTKGVGARGVESQAGLGVSVEQEQGAEQFGKGLALSGPVLWPVAAHTHRERTRRPTRRNIGRVGE